MQPDGGPADPRPGARELIRRCLVAGRLAFSAGPVTGLAVGLAALDGAVMPAVAWVTKLLVDTLATGGAAAGGRTAVLGATLIGLGALGGAQRGLTTFTHAAVGRAVRWRAKDRLMRRVNAIVGLGPFEDPRFLDRLRLAAQSGEQAPEQLMASGLGLLQSAVRVGGFVAALAAVWPPMAVLAAAAAVPTALLHVRLGRRRAGVTTGLAGLLRRQMFFQALLIEPTAAKEVRLFSTGDFLRRRLITDVRRANLAEAALARRVLRTDLALEGLSAVLTVVGVAAACTLALGGRISLGDVTVFLAAATAMHASVVGATASVGQAYEALLLLGAYTGIVDSPDRRRSPSETPDVPADPLPMLSRAIEVRDVWFRYTETGPWVLRGVSLTIPHGTTVGLVGLNGAGKSTLVKLLCRMYEPQRGQILWDGRDIAHTDPAELRRRISAVFQDFMTYDMTARENIALGDLARLDDTEAIARAAGAAGIHKDLQALPRGYETLLSRAFWPEDGASDAIAQLSGGQWQRVAVARAFLRETDLYILDEPTSGLDAEAEAVMQERLRELYRDRTALLISHRLGTLRDADQIVVLVKGRVAERGRHAELMAADGAYAGLFTLQARGYRDDHSRTSTRATTSR
jgi:ATP-binding cassette subfamily B protein